MGRVARAIERYEHHPGGRFRHWLRRVAKNAILTVLTRRPHDVGAGGTDAIDILAELPDVSPAAEEELATEFMREQFLCAAVIVRADVNAATWQAFDLTVTRGMSCEEAAKAMGKSVGTIYAARSRIIKRLREQIERMQGDDQ